MKNFYIQTIVLLFIASAGFISKSNAQFASSEQVYCYQYVKTVDDGVSSKMSGQDEIYFVNFQRDMMGFTTVKTSKEAGKKIVENSRYYSDKAINDLAENWKKWNYKPFQDNVGKVTILKYSSSYSTSGKYTYQQYYKAGGSRQEGFKTAIGFGGYPYQAPNWVDYWTDPVWRSGCYSFSIDKTEMIVWSTDNPSKRHYYKRIDPNSLKPNLDFLD